MSHHADAENGPGADAPLVSKNEHHKLHDDGKLPDVVFVAAEVQQVNLYQQTPKYIGLSKAELERYVDDPFWKRLRWILFILFWLAWIAMFAAAIAIVVTHPKCPDKPLRTWWHKKVCYQVYTRTFQDSDADGVGDFAGLAKRVDDLKNIGVHAIWAVPVLQSDDFSGYSVTNFSAVDQRLGTEEDFEDAIKKVHDKGMYFIMDFVPGATSLKHPWLSQSFYRKPPYENYYIWDETPRVPNEEMWFQVKPESPGSSRATRNVRISKDHGSGLAVLDLSNPLVLDEMKSAMRVWLDRGVDGFYIYTDKMVLADKFRNEQNWDKTYEVLAALREAAQEYSNQTDKEILLFTSSPLKDDERADLISKGMLNLVINNDISSSTVDKCGAECVSDFLNNNDLYHKKFNATWPMWEVGSPYQSRIGTRFGGSQYSELMTLMLLMLPGSVTAYYGDEIGLMDMDTSALKKDPNSIPDPAKFASRSPMQWDTGKNFGFSEAEPSLLPIPVNNKTSHVDFKTLYDKSASSLRTFKKLAKLHVEDDTFLYGTFDVGQVVNNSVVTFARKKAGGFNFLVALNFGKARVDFILKDALNITVNAANVVDMTSNMYVRQAYGMRQEVNIANQIRLEPAEGIVLKYK